MDKEFDSYKKLVTDLLEQFRNHPKIDVLIKALSAQLQEVYDFFVELRVKCWLDTAEGAQLDVIGDIVCMSRTQAFILAGELNQNIPMDDETYRVYLLYKILKNTNTCTYPDIMNALELFWGNIPLKYHEDPAHPATMFLSTPPIKPSDKGSAHLLLPRIKAAGVKLVIEVNTEEDELEKKLYFSGVRIGSISRTILPPLS